MYTCIGKKLKGLAIAMFIILAIAAIVCGFVFGNELDSGGSGFLIFLSGAFIALVSSWVLYGFGELIDKVCSIESALKGKTTAEIRKENNKKNSPRTEQVQQTTNNLSRAEQFQQAMSNLADLKAKGYASEKDFQQTVGNKPDC